MDGEGIKQILANVPKPQLVTVAGVEQLLVPHGEAWLESKTGPDVPPAPLHVHTLSGLVAYVLRNHDKLALDGCVLHVVHQAEVRLRGGLLPAPFHRRHDYVVASTEALFGRGFSFGAYYDRETFNVDLQTLFVDSAARQRVLAIVGNLKEEQVRDSADDGTTQTVTGRAGVVLGKDVAVPNPVSLQPYRTFREIAQPASLFVLRLQSGKEGGLPKCALFECDGGAWKLEAISSIRDYLKRELGDVPLAILA